MATYTYTELLREMNAAFRKAAEERKKGVINFAALPGSEARLDAYVSKMESYVTNMVSNGHTVTEPINVRDLARTVLPKMEAKLIEWGYTLGTEATGGSDVPQITREELDAKLPELFAEWVQWLHTQQTPAGGAAIERLSHGYMGW